MSRRIILLLTIVAMTIPAAALAESTEARDGSPAIDVEPIVQEWNEDGTPHEETPRVGRSILLRRSQGLSAIARIEGLKPGGVYTFWWIVIQDDGTFPDDYFVASGDGAVVGQNGKATAFMRASTGQPSIRGFMPDGVNEIIGADLQEPLDAIVRIEVAYHGQAEDAGDDLETWLEDFWTGTACPPETPNPNPAQPHCPVYYASTHTP